MGISVLHRYSHLLNIAKSVFAVKNAILFKPTPYHDKPITQPPPEVPKWADVVKTGVAKELAPSNSGGPSVRHFPFT